MANSESDDKRVLQPLHPAWLIILWAIALIATVGLLGANILLGDLNQDEGWYLYGARLVSQGQLPYRDFAFTQGPVMPVVYVLAQPFVKAMGFAGGRLFTAILALAGSILASVLAARLVPPDRKHAAALFAFILIGVNIYQTYFCAVVKTYALGSLLLILGFLFLSSASRRRTAVPAFFSGVFLALAAGTRISAGLILPVALIALCFTVSRRRQTEYPASRAAAWTSLAMFALGAAVTSAAVFLPFIRISFANFLFCVGTYHTGREAGGLGQTLFLKAGSVCRLVNAYFVAFVIFVIVFLARWFYRPEDRDADRPSGRYLAEAVVPPILWASSILVALLHLAAPFPYDEYQVMIMPLFAVALSVTVARRLKTPRLQLAVLAVLLIASLGAAASSTLAQGWVVKDIDRLWIRKKDMPPLRKLQETGRVIKSLAGDDTLLLTQDPYLAVETGMTLPHGLEMGQFSYFPEMSRTSARAFNVLNRGMFEDLLRNCPARVAALSGYALAVRSPQVTELSEPEQSALWAIVNERYEPIRQVPGFGQAYTTLRIMRRRDSP